MEKTSKYKLSGILADELLVAIGEKNVPELFVQYNVSLVGESGGSEDHHSVLMNINLSFGGKSINQTLSRNFSVRRHLVDRDGEARISHERLGILDLIEEAMRSGLAELLPEAAEEINQAKVTVYTVNAIGHRDSHLVSVSLRFAIASRNKDKQSDGSDFPEINEEETLSAEKVADSGLICVGADTVRATLECMRVFFNWYLWRILRRNRGRKRHNR